MKKKSIVDYLKLQEDKRQELYSTKWKGKESITTEISLVLVEYGVHIYINGDLKEIVSINSICIDDEIEDYLEETYDIEIRFCEYCGCAMNKGYTDDFADFYNCEKCFPKDMDERYGKGNWRTYEGLGDDCNELGGFYEYLDNGEWCPEPSYYTEWE